MTSPFCFPAHGVRCTTEAICRPSDRTVGRPRAEIRTKVERSIEAGTLTTRLPHLPVSVRDITGWHCCPGFTQGSYSRLSCLKVCLTSLELVALSRTVYNAYMYNAYMYNAYMYSVPKSAG